MEAATFKSEDCASQWAANDSPDQPFTHSTTDEKVGSSSSLCLGWVNNISDSSSEQFTSLHTSPNSNMLGRDIGFPGDLGYTQAFQNAKPYNYLANFISPSHLLPPTQAGVLPARKNNETMGIPSSAATSPLLTAQEGLFCQNKEQSPGEQEQLMMHRMEQLQRLVTEQQKIITFYNPGFSVSPGIPPHLLAMIPSLPGVPAALFPAQLPLKNSLQVQDKRCSQTNPLIMKCNFQQCVTRTSANSSFPVVSKEHLEPHETGANMEPLSQSHETSADNPSRQNPVEEKNAAVKGDDGHISR
ncbi:uncharacterized protein LOC134398174 [Elgaria multicarinata webbii]|uniref:uncharacterized protein LOC134398174 n=1 Tax=Elgaria multicarinata webbii TaxID=159646 RepID=UPI002FCCD13A